MPERLDEYWARVAPGLDRIIEQGTNGAVEDLLHHTIAFMAFTVENLPNRATRNQELLGTLDALDILAFDALRSAEVAQRVLSLAGTALATRLILEACCTMRFITESGVDAANYARRYARWMHVETLEHHRQTEQTLPWDELIAHATEAAEWLEEDSFRVRRNAHWANNPRYANLFVIAEHLGLQEDYRRIYSAGSAFTHATSTASRLYRHGQHLRHVADPKHSSRLSILAASLALKLHRAFLDFHGVAYEANDLAALMARILAAAQTVGA